MDRKKRTVVVIIVILLLVAPLAVIVIASPWFRTYLSRIPSQKHVATDSRFSARSDVAGYRFRLEDSQFLEFITANLHLFDTNGVVDPLSIRAQETNPKRFTITNIDFILVPSVTNPLGILTKGGIGRDQYKTTGEATYTVEGDTMVVRIALHFDVLAGDIGEKYLLEKTALRVVANTLYYAKGEVGAFVQLEAIAAIDKQIDIYMLSGLFPWSFSLEQL